MYRTMRIVEAAGKAMTLGMPVIAAVGIPMFTISAGVWAGVAFAMACGMSVLAGAMVFWE